MAGDNGIRGTDSENYNRALVRGIVAGVLPY